MLLLLLLLKFFVFFFIFLSHSLFLLFYLVFVFQHNCSMNTLMLHILIRYVTIIRSITINRYHNDYHFEGYWLLLHTEIAMKVIHIIRNFIVRCLYIHMYLCILFDIQFQRTLANRLLFSLLCFTLFYCLIKYIKHFIFTLCI